jgi:hypothetical protein
LGITCSFWWGYTRRSGERRLEQGLASQQVTQGDEGLDGQAWYRRLMHAAACERIEHPRGHRQLQAILELDAQTLRGLPP